MLYEKRITKKLLSFGNMKIGNDTAIKTLGKNFIKCAVKPIHRFLAWIGCKAQR